MKDNRRTAIRTALLSMAGNGLLALAKGVAGVLGHSNALIADAIESLNDVLASLLVVFGLRYSTLPPDENHPYGHGKAEPLITFAVVAILVASAGVIAWQSIVHILGPREAPHPFTLAVLAAVIVIKELMYRMVNKKGRETGSSSLTADAWHHRSDAITSGAAFIGIGIAVVMGEGYESADDWAALLACGFILYNAYRIFRPALGEVMDEQRHPDVEREVRRLAANTHGVQGTEKCYIRKTGFTFHVDLHLHVDGRITVQEGHDIAHQVKDTIREGLPQVADVHIHVEPA